MGQGTRSHLGVLAYGSGSTGSVIVEYGGDRGDDAPSDRMGERCPGFGHELDGGWPRASRSWPGSSPSTRRTATRSGRPGSDAAARSGSRRRGRHESRHPVGRPLRDARHGEVLVELPGRMPRDMEECFSGEILTAPPPHGGSLPASTTSPYRRRLHFPRGARRMPRAEELASASPRGALPFSCL